MLRMSFCDPLNVRRPSCVVGRASTISTSFFSETTGQILMIFSINSLKVTLMQFSTTYDDISEDMASRGRGQFPWYNIIRKTLKIFFSETTGQIWIIFGINSLCVTLMQVSKIHDDIYKTWLPGGGANSLIYLYRKH